MWATFPTQQCNFSMTIQHIHANNLQAFINPPKTQSLKNFLKLQCIQAWIQISILICRAQMPSTWLLKGATLQHWRHWLQLGATLWLRMWVVSGVFLYSHFLFCVNTPPMNSAAFCAEVCFAAASFSATGYNPTVSTYSHWIIEFSFPLFHSCILSNVWLTSTCLKHSDVIIWFFGLKLLFWTNVAAGEEATHPTCST